MSTGTSIEWAEATWNPTTGCDRVSAGCDNCYALTLAKRLKGMGSAKYQTDGDPRTSGPGFGLATHDDALTIPLRWGKPRRVFVNSMSDLFHDRVSDEFIARVFAVMAMAGHHTFQVLTKRHARMRSLLSSDRFETAVGAVLIDPDLIDPDRPGGSPWTITRKINSGLARPLRWPLPNVHLVVSVEDQHWAGIRIPILFDTPAAVRGVSIEPMLGPVQIRQWLYSEPVAGHCIDIDGYAWHDGCQHCARLDWVIVGGESGPGARPLDPDWARSLRDQCVDAGVPFFFKQWGDWCHEDQMPEDTWSWLDSAINLGQQPHPEPHRVGKKRAGRLLDGRTWDEYPDAARYVPGGGE